MLTTKIQTYLCICLSDYEQAQTYYNLLPSRCSPFFQTYIDIVSSAEITDEHIIEKNAAEEEKQLALGNSLHVTQCINEMNQLYNEFVTTYGYTEQTFTNPNIIPLLDINTSQEDIANTFQQYFNYKITTLFSILTTLNHIHVEINNEIQRAIIELEAANEYCKFVEDYVQFIQNTTTPDTIGEIREVIRIMQDRQSIYNAEKAIRSQEREKAKLASETMNLLVQIDCNSHMATFREEKQYLDLDKSLDLNDVRELYNNINNLINDYNTYLMSEIDYSSEIAAFESQKQNDILECINALDNNHFDVSINELKNAIIAKSDSIDNILNDINILVNDLKTKFDMLKEHKIEKDLIVLSQTFMDVRDARLLNERMQKIKDCIDQFQDVDTHNEIENLLNTHVEMIDFDGFLATQKGILKPTLDDQLLNIINIITSINELIIKSEPIIFLYSNSAQEEYTTLNNTDIISTIETKIQQLSTSTYQDDILMFDLLTMLLELYERNYAELTNIILGLFIDIVSINYYGPEVIYFLIQYINYFKHVLVSTLTQLNYDKNILTQHNSMLLTINMDTTGCELLNNLHQGHILVDEINNYIANVVLPDTNLLDSIKDYLFGINPYIKHFSIILSQDSQYILKLLNMMQE